MQVKDNKLELMAQYSKRTKELNHHNGLCEGYYKITEIVALTYNSGYLNIIMSALWHPTDATLTENFYPITTSFNSLTLKNSTGPKEVSWNQLINGIIKVNKVEVFDREYNDEVKKSLKVDWEIVEFSPTNIK